jgi:MerR family mercuric resistance operon transcriptional regulator
MVQSQGPRQTIGKLAEAGSVGVETVRFYQRKGLLQTPSRSTGFRQYGADDVRRLKFIRQAQGAGFTLEEIQELLCLDAGEDRTRAREMARKRIGALDTKIAELKQSRDALKRLADECAEGSTGHCPIISSFVVDT